MFVRTESVVQLDELDAASGSGALSRRLNGAQAETTGDGTLLGIGVRSVKPSSGAEERT